MELFEKNKLIFETLSLSLSLLLFVMKSCSSSTSSDFLRVPTIHKMKNNVHFPAKYRPTLLTSSLWKNNVNILQR